MAVHSRVPRTALANALARAGHTRLADTARVAEPRGQRIPAWRKAVSHDTAGEHWNTIRYQDKFGQVDVPILHISGWYDDAQVAAPMNYHGMVAGAATPFARQNQLVLSVQSSTGWA